MREDEIVQIAIENLQNNSGIIVNWVKGNESGIDGQVTLIVEEKNLNFYAEIKQELRNHQLPQIFNQAVQYYPLMVIANHIFPKIKEDLRQRQIAYLEANGNIYVHHNNTTIWIDTKKTIKNEKGTDNRAFTKTGLKVIFHFLINENIVNQTYREIASQTNVGLGNINYVINGLKELGFLIKLDKDNYKLMNKRELLNKWIDAYDERLKPSIKVGTFRFLKQEDFTNWKMIPLRNGRTWWGGEPAGDLLTGYLRPAELTIYTTEQRNELIKNYRLIPDELGNVKVYKKFWQYDEVNDNIVPPLLVYADLINANDKRCHETAIKIYEQLIQPNV